MGEQQEERQRDSSAEEDEESEIEVERDTRLDKEERPIRSAVSCMQTAYAFTDKRKTRTDKMTRGDDKQQQMEEEVPEVSTSASNHEKGTLRKGLAFRKRLAKTDLTENTTSNTLTVPTVPWMRALSLDTGDYKVLGRSQLDYPILASQDGETSEMAFRPLLKAEMVPVPKDKQLSARTPAAPKRIGITNISAFSALKDHSGYTEFQYARAFPTVLGKIHGHTLPMLIDR